MLIVDALPKPVFPRIATKESRESRAARLDLYHLACVSTDFFYPAMQEAWKVLPDVKVLIKTLHIGAMNVELESASWRTYKAVELSLLSFVEQAISPSNAENNLQFKHFKYYAACPRQLRVCSGNYLELILCYAQQLAPQDSGNIDFFQSLEELVWTETAGCFEPRLGNIAQFLRAPRLTSVYLQFADPHGMSFVHLIDDENQRIYEDIVLQVGREVSCIRPKLSRLTISAPIFVPICPSVLRGFTDIQAIVLQLNVPRPNNAGILPFDPLCAPRRLELLWTQTSDFRNLPQNVSLRALETLIIRSLDYAASTFVPQITQLAFATTECLTTVELFSVDHGSAAMNCGEFIHFIHPLLSRPQLRSLSAVLNGYSFAFSAGDLDTIASAWPALEMLNISVGLELVDRLPNLQHVLYVLCKRCPRLSYLHLPGLATPPGEGAISIPRFPTSPLYHISSDVFVRQHNMMDLVYALQRSFPCLMELGPSGVTTSSWTELQELLLLQRSRDLTSIMEHTATSLRNGTYTQVPYVSSLSRYIAYNTHLGHCFSTGCHSAA
ncbi:hypothetical protein C2E23DRAFT_735192 [Lenzites betulinus]|nr:hypothetical protein C2E23DRAFT_735192 [Lenzites betulinus]